MSKLFFTVDSALIRELGERLVGQPHIALAELIKNSYDADAGLVEVRISDDVIEIVDDGHGMSAAEFRNYWMRIGSTHKAQRDASPGGRSLTGSKGVGRLAVQFLGAKVRLESSASGRKGSFLAAAVDWNEAAEAGELTKAEAEVDFSAEPTTFAAGSKTGTRIVLTELRQTWDRDTIQALAHELWPLQSPFAAQGQGGFRIALETPDAAAAKAFQDEMGAVLKLWEARIVGTLGSPAASSGKGRRRRRHVHVDVYFDDGTRAPLDTDLQLSHLDSLSFEIRVYRLQGRQKYGISVEEARKYFRKFGGVHIYDAGFNLPYYGAETDWLRVEQDHAHRLSQSQLLPDEYQVENGLRYLPTNSRLYGVVNIDTGAERRAAREEGRPERDALTIQVSRDRLVDNDAYRELSKVVRTALDFYATRAALRALGNEGDQASGQVLTTRAASLEDVIEAVRDELSESSWQRLRDAAASVDKAAEQEAERIARQAGLLGALAAAGIAAVALEHESARELRQLERLATRLRRATTDPKEIADELNEWVQRTRATRQVFRPLMDQESRETVQSYGARSLIAAVAQRSSLMLRGMEIDVDDLPASLLLPPGRMSEWNAIWQNVLVNASRATLGRKDRRVKFVSETHGRNRAIFAMDNGHGIDLRHADRYFEPFGRGNANADGRDLVSAGTGMGLTIVRMVARNLGCHVAFVKPELSGYRTAFRLSWRTA